MTAAAAASVSEALRAAARRLRASGSRSPRLDAELLLATALGVRARRLLRATPERALTPVEERALRGLRPAARGARAGRLHPRPPRLPHDRARGHARRAHPAARDRDAGRRRAGGAGRRPRPSAGRAARPRRRHRLGLHRPGAGGGGPVRARGGGGRRSEAAVELARRNAARLGLGGRVALPARRPLRRRCRRTARFDVIVSNPPYVPAAEYDDARAQRARLRAAPRAARRRGRPRRLPAARPRGARRACARRGAGRGGRRAGQAAAVAGAVRGGRRLARAARARGPRRHRRAWSGRA